MAARVLLALALYMAVHGTVAWLTPASRVNAPSAAAEQPRHSRSTDNSNTDCVVRLQMNTSRASSLWTFADVDATLPDVRFSREHGLTRRARPPRDPYPRIPPLLTPLLI